MLKLGGYNQIPSEGCQMVAKGCQFNILYRGFNWQFLGGAGTQGG